MIAHVILFKPRPGLAPAERAAVLEALTAASRDIPGIRSFRVGKRVRHGLPGYEQMMAEDFEFLVIIEVDDLDALRGYLAHPSHADFGAHFTASSAAALAYDYEVVDVEDALRLVAG